MQTPEQAHEPDPVTGAMAQTILLALGRLEGRIAGIEPRLIDIDRRVSERFSDMDRRVSELVTKHEAHERRIQLAENTIQRVPDLIVAEERVDARLTIIERAQASMSGAHNFLRSQLTVMLALAGAASAIILHFVH